MKRNDEPNYLSLSKVLIHLAIIALLTYKSVWLSLTDSYYSRSILQSSLFFFKPSYYLNQDVTELYTYDQVKSSLQVLLDNFNNINNRSVGYFQYYNDNSTCSNEPGEVVLKTSYWSDPYQYHSKDIFLTNETLNNLFENEISYFHNLDTLRIQFSICDVQETSNSRENKCNVWKIETVYSFVSQMYIEVHNLGHFEKSCSEDSSEYDGSNPLTQLDLTLLMLTLIYFYFITKDIISSVLLYIKVKQAHTDARKKYLLNQLTDSKDTGLIAASYDWKDIPTGIKRSFHCYWSLTTFIGNIIVLAEVFYSLQAKDYRLAHLSHTGKGLLGLSCFLLWTTAIQFLSTTSIFSLTLLMQTALPRILAFLIGLVPVYFGFLFLGISIFGSRLGMFGTLEITSSSLFAFMNGDSVLPILQLLELKSFWAALFFGVVFMIITTYLMLNLLISIVDESYFVAKKRDRYLNGLLWKNLQRIIGSKANEMNVSETEYIKSRKDLEEYEDDEWFSSVFTSMTTQKAAIINGEDLTISLAEEAAEMYILGQSHWEYSKMMDYVAEHIE